MEDKVREMKTAQPVKASAKTPETSTSESLLRELINEQRKTTRFLQILAALTAVLLLTVFLTAVVIVPKMNRTLKQAETVMTEAEGLAEATGAALEGIPELLSQCQGSLTGIDEMVGNVNGLVEDNTEAITESIEKLNGVDFETLNQSIRELHSILEPIANFFGRFS